MSTVETNLEGIQSQVASFSVEIPKKIQDVGEKVEKIEF